MSSPTTFQRAVSWAYLATLWRGVSTLVLTFVLVAILSPRDFGLVAMAAAYILFIEMLVGLGMNVALIQRKRLTRAHLDSVFWLVLACGLLLTGVSIAASKWWAIANAQPELARVVTVLSASILLKGLTVVPQALLQRRMDFRSLALLGGVTSVVGGGVGITMALSGAGVWSLVAQTLVSSAISTVLMWRIAAWWPRLQFSWRRVRSLLGFSGSAFASQLGVYVSGQSDAILVGLFFGPVALGLYRLANRMIEMVLEIGTRSIQLVALPHFSSLQNRPNELRRAVLSCIRLSATITIPLLALLAATSDEIMAVLGPEWRHAADVIQILAVIGFTKTVLLFSGPLLFAQGRAKTVAAHMWVLGLITAATIAGIAAAYREMEVDRQIAAVALGRVFVFVLFFGVFRMILTCHLCSISLAQIARAIVPGVGMAGGAILTAALVSHGVGSGLAPVAALLTALVPAAIVVAGLLLVLEPVARRLVWRVVLRTPGGAWG